MSGLRIVNDTTSTYIIATICIIHALVFLIPTCLIIRPNFTDYDMGTDMFAGLNFIYNTLASTLFVIVQFAAQFSVLWKLGGSEAVSRWTLGLQIPIFILLSVSWNYKFDSPFAPDSPPRQPGFWGFYDIASYLDCNIGWPVLNHALAALGQFALFALCLFMDWHRSWGWMFDSGSGFQDHADKPMPLLGEL